MSQLSPAHIALLRLLAKQAVASYLTPQTKETEGEAPMRQNHPSLQMSSPR
jgi:hypothetical protein